MSSCTHTCPTADKGNHGLGPSSHTQGTSLFCTYATSTRVDNSDTFCSYDLSTGALLVDYDGGLCLAQAIPQGCATPSHKNKHTMTAAIAGSLGGLAFILVCATAYFFYRRRSKAKLASV